MAIPIDFRLVLILCILNINLYNCSEDSDVFSYHVGSGFEIQYDMMIKNVTTNEYFNNYGLFNYKTIRNGMKSVTVARNESHFQIFIATRENNKFGFKKTSIEAFETTVQGIALYLKYNKLAERDDVYLTCYSSKDISRIGFYRVSNDAVEKISEMYVNVRIYYMEYFQYHDENFAVLVSKDKNTCGFQVLWFLTPVKTRVEQFITIECLVTVATIVTHRGYIFFTMYNPAIQKLVIYKLIRRAQFEMYQQIDSKEEITSLVSFNIGVKSFLAVGRKDAVIYQFTRNGILLERVVGGNLDNVVAWLVLPRLVYRDEVILVTQRIISHTTHNATYTEIVLYNGIHFVFQEQVACFHHEVKMTLTECMTDTYHHNEGLLLHGTVVYFKDMFAVLMARLQSNKTEILMFNVDYRPIQTPLQKQIKYFQNLKLRLQEKIDGLKPLLKKFKKPTEDPLIISETSKAARETETAPNPILKKSPSSDSLISNLEKKVNLTEIKARIQNIRHEIEKFENMIGNTTNLNKRSNYISKLTVNGSLEIRNETVLRHIVTEKLNSEEVPGFLKDLVRKDNIMRIPGDKTFTDIEVDNISFDSLNNSVVSNSKLLINKTTEFNNPVTVISSITSESGLVNSYSLKDEVVIVGNDTVYDEPLEFEHLAVRFVQTDNTNVNFSVWCNEAIELDTLNIAGNVTIETINRKNFNKFKNNLLFTNINTHIIGHTVLEGELTGLGNLEVEVINNIKFPEDYVLKDSEQLIISGIKTFESGMFVQQLTANEVNGINTDDIITLNTNQTLSTPFTFTHLEVTRNITIKDVIPAINETTINPTLSEANTINASVNFHDLIVNGNVVISNQVNGLKFENLLKDIVYKNVSEVNIDSTKDFLQDVTVNKNLHSVSSSINEINLNKLLTKDTEQIIETPVIYGQVRFNNLTLAGLYGDTNVTQLSQESLKTTGDQQVTSVLIFHNNSDNQTDLSADELTITKTLNKIPINNYYFTKGDRIFKKTLRFDDLSCENIVVDENVRGNLKSFSLEDFDKNRLSYTRDQDVSAEYNIKSLSAKTLTVDIINGEAMEDRLSDENYINRMREEFLEGKLKVKRLVADNSIVVHNINGQSTDWCKSIDTFEVINFKNNVITDHLNVDQFNAIKFNTFKKNILYNRDKNIEINSFKTLQNGFKVQKILNSPRLNNIHVDDILMKSGKQTVVGPIIIKGNVNIENDFEIRRALNSYPIRDLLNSYQLDKETYTIYSDASVNSEAFIKQLQVGGNADGKNIKGLLENIVYKQRAQVLPGNIKFIKPVRLQQNLYISESLNNIDFPEFIENVIHITNDDFIRGNITFKRAVQVDEELFVNDLVTRYINGIDLSNWTDNAVFINRGRIPGVVEFENVEMRKNIKIDYLNDIAMDTVITLDKDEKLDFPMKFLEIRTGSHIAVGNLVNNENLEYLSNTTLLKDKLNQEISHTIRFHGPVSVRHKLSFNGLVNRRNISKIVTTNSQQNLTGFYNFKERVTFVSELNLKNKTINSINLDEWNKNAISRYNEDIRSQTVKHDWNVLGNVTFNNVWGDKSLGNFNVVSMLDLINERQMQRNKTKMSLQAHYETLCNEINMSLHQMKNQVYFFKYLEFLNYIKTSNKINYVYHFVHDKNVYVLLNEEDLCKTSLYIWESFQFRKLMEFSTGNLLQFIKVYDDDLLFLVGRNEKSANCKIRGTYVWKFEQNSLKMKMLLEDQQLLQESLIPGTFYALNNNIVVEYKIITDIESDIKKRTKWILSGGNLMFVPRGLGIGLALSNGTTLFRLKRENPIIKEENRYEIDTLVIGDFTEEENTVLPGYKSNEVLMLTVGMQQNRKTLIAVAKHEETRVRGRFDIIKIYEDVQNARIFHKVPSYKPTSLISLEFGNGETLLVFLEDEKFLQVYEYKGIEGFKHRTSARIDATSLMVLDLPINVGFGAKKVIGVLNKNILIFIEAIMTGNQIKFEKLACDLL